MDEQRTEFDGKRVRSLVIARAVLAVFSIGVIMMLTASASELAERYENGLWLLGLTIVLDIGYFLVGRYVRNKRLFTLLQVTVDTVLITAMVYLTGGANSVFPALYFAIVLGGNVLMGPRTGLFFASLSTTLIAGVSTLYFLGSHYNWDLPFLSTEFIATYKERHIADIIAFLIAEAVGLHVVAILSGLLARSMHQYQALYEEILRNMGEGLIALDRQGKILFVNRDARNLLGYYKNDPVDGRKFGQVFRRREDDIIHSILSRQEEVNLDINVRLREEKQKNINIRTSHLLDRNGKNRGIIGIFTDLTARKRLEMLEQKASRLDEMSELAAGIAHEIRNPLASVRGAVQEIGKLDIEGDDNKKLSEIIMRESDRLDDIISDFLQFAKMQAPSLAPADLGPILDETVMLLKTRPDAAGVEIELDLDADYTVMADPAQLKQVFLNIGINALEALGGNGRIEISTRKAEIPGRVLEESGGTHSRVEDAVSVTFRDTGRGIDPELAGKIFTPFFTTKTEGTGMGLSIVDKIVSSHRGAIDVVGGGEGAAFRVLLPLVEKGNDSPEETDK